MAKAVSILDVEQMLQIAQMVPVITLCDVLSTITMKVVESASCVICRITMPVVDAKTTRQNVSAMRVVHRFYTCVFYCFVEAVVSNRRFVRYSIHTVANAD